MDYSTLFLVFCLISTLLIVGLLVFLYLQAMQQLRENAAIPRDFLSEAMETWQGSMEAMMLQTVTSQRESLTQILAMATSETGRQQMLTAKALEQGASQAISGSTSALNKVTAILSDALTALAVKDPMAYQMMRGAALTESAGSTEPYTTVDEEALAAAVALEKEIAERIGVSLGHYGSTDEDANAGPGNGPHALGIPGLNAGGLFG